MGGGPWMMGPGMMGPGYGGMMGYGGPWMMSPGYNGSSGPGYNNAPAANHSTNDVKAYLERWIAFTANPNLKVGKVTEKDGTTITAEIVTKDGSLVQRYSVDRRTGAYYPVQ